LISFSSESEGRWKS
jgi:hypothetical protein